MRSLTPGRFSKRVALLWAVLSNAASLPILRKASILDRPALYSGHSVRISRLLAVWNRGCDPLEPMFFCHSSRSLSENGPFISVTRHLLTQGALKKFVQSHFDRTEVVTRISFQEAITDQSVNFRYA